MRRDKAGLLIKAAREDVSMTQSALARAAGIHQPTLAAYESGRRIPRPDTLQRILVAARARPSVVLELMADEVIHSAMNHGLANVRVFGSAVRGEDTERSDIDLLVSAGHAVSLFDLGAFAAEVQELTGFATDVLTEEQTRNPHFAHVLDESRAVMNDAPEPREERFVHRPWKQVAGDSSPEAIDRDPAIIAELRSLLAVCEEIASLGRESFLRSQSELTYFAAEAVIIHFNELVTHRLRAHVEMQHPDFPWRGIAGTRNILAHNYTRANRSVVWGAISEELPGLLRALLTSLERPGL